MISVDKRFLIVLVCGSQQICRDLVGTTADGLTLTMSNGTTTANGPALTLGKWHYIALRVSGTGAGAYKVYLDGVEQISMASSAGVSSFNQVTVGANAVAADPLDGRFSNLIMWSAALSEDEIEMQMFRPIPAVRKNSLNGWYPCRFEHL